MAVGFVSGFAGALAAIHLGLADGPIEEVASFFDDSGEIERLEEKIDAVEDQTDAVEDQTEEIGRSLNIIP